MYIEVKKKTSGKYEVAPDITPSAGAPSFSNNIIHIMKGDINVFGIMPDGSFLQNESDIPNVKWWGDVGGGPSYRYFYTTGTDNVESIYDGDYSTQSSLETIKNCEITYSNGTLSIYNETEAVDYEFEEHDTMPLACFSLINPTS